MSWKWKVSYILQYLKFSLYFQYARVLKRRLLLKWIVFSLYQHYLLSKKEFLQFQIAWTTSKTRNNWQLLHRTESYFVSFSKYVPRVTLQLYWKIIPGQVFSQTLFDLICNYENEKKWRSSIICSKDNLWERLILLNEEELFLLFYLTPSVPLLWVSVSKV